MLHAFLIASVAVLGVALPVTPTTTPASPTASDEDASIDGTYGRTDNDRVTMTIVTGPFGLTGFVIAMYDGEPQWGQSGALAWDPINGRYQLVNNDGNAGYVKQTGPDSVSTHMYDSGNDFDWERTE